MIVLVGFFVYIILQYDCVIEFGVILFGVVVQVFVVIVLA